MKKKPKSRKENGRKTRGLEDPDARNVGYHKELESVWFGGKVGKSPFEQVGLLVRVSQTARFGFTWGIEGSIAIDRTLIDPPSKHEREAVM